MNKTWLSHHGVKGQKWGKRNGPPYPLDDAGKKQLARNIERDINIDHARVLTGRKKASNGENEIAIVKDHIKANVSDKRQKELEGIVDKLSNAEPYSDDEIDALNDFADWQQNLSDDLFDVINMGWPVSILCQVNATGDEEIDELNGIFAEIKLDLGDLLEGTIDDACIEMFNDMIDKRDKK